MDANIPVRSYEVLQANGQIYYFINQKDNQASIAFWPSGIYDNNFLVCGHVSTISTDHISLDLYKAFCKSLKKGFVKIEQYYVSPAAYEISKKVRLITINVKQPIKYDLRIP